MYSPFVKGLMCATLLHLGLSACFVLIQGIARHAPPTLLLWYAPGVFVVALALLLFTSISVIAQVAFWILLVLGLSNIAAPLLHPLPQTVFHASKSSGIFYGLILLFPCLIALLSGKRGGTSDV